MGDMPWVTPDARRAIAAAVRVPPRYASLRLRSELGDADLLQAPFQRVAAPAAKPAVAPPPPVVWPEGAPPAPIAIQQLYDEGVYDDEIVPWLQQAEQAMRALASGRDVPRVSKLVIKNERMPEWARKVVWDTANPADCRPVRRSTADTWEEDFPGPKIDPVALREAAEELNWPDKDIVEMATGGGLEGRFDAPLDTVLAFHHQGVVKPPFEVEGDEGRGAASRFQAVDTVVREDVRKGWTSAPFAHLPFAPCRIVPRNVVLNQKQKVEADGSIRTFWKPRVTTDDSFPHDGSSMNAGTPKAETSTELPTPQHLAWALAVILKATDAAGLQACLWSLDFSDAYRYVPTQRAEHWANCFYWTGGVHVERRGVFGAAWMPQKFQRLSSLARAAAAHEIAAFTRDVPEPAEIQRWRGRRGHAGLAGEDLLASFLQMFIDDTNGVGSSERVELPPQWAHLHPREQEQAATEAATRAVGGTPAHPYARAAVECRAAASVYRRLGFQVSSSKTQCGSKIASLGLRANVDQRRLDAIPQKAAALRADARELLHQAQPGLEISFRRLERFTGRVNYVAQVAPELKVDLRYAHAILKGGRKLRDGRVLRGTTKGVLKVGGGKGGSISRPWLGLRRLLSTVKTTVESVAVPLAPAARFCTPAEGAAVVHTDANRDDGCGGWCWQRLPSQRWKLWTFEVQWPEWVRQALLSDQLSMPSGELFGSLLGKAMAEDVLRAKAVILVTDCQPVRGAVNAQSSPSPQMHELVRATYATKPSTQALCVHVKREENQAADDLSKGLGAKVRQEAAAAGFEVGVWLGAEAQRGAWEALRRAADLPQAP